MITLSLKDSGAVLGSIDEDDLQLLQDHLEEETEGDTDYYIDPLTIDMLQSAGASSDLVAILKRAVGDLEGVEIIWREAS